MPDWLLPLFFGAWCGFAVATVLLHSKGSLEAKRRWHPRLVIGAGMVMVAFVAAILPFALYVAIPAVALITFLNLKFTKFCPACRATLVQNPPWTPLRFCPRCGADLAS